MKQDRLEKAESISQKIVSEYIVTELQDLSLEFGIITLTDVKISKDLSYIDLYVSSLKNEEILCKSLAPHAKKIQEILGKKIDFLKVPLVRFRYDESGKISFDIYQHMKKTDR